MGYLLQTNRSLILLHKPAVITYCCRSRRRTSKGKSNSSITVNDVDQIASGEDLIPVLLSEIVALIGIGAVIKSWGYYVRSTSCFSLKVVCRNL